MGWFLIVLSLFTILQLFLFNLRLSETVKCQANINTSVAVALSNRAKLTDQDRDNTYSLVSEILSSPDNETTVNALQHYLDQKVQIDLQRSKIHIPNPETIKSCD